jgi:hypothetical protein
MPPTPSITDCRRFADAVTEAGGTIPAPLARLLSTADLLMRPAAAQDPVRGILDAARAEKLDEKTLDKLIADAAQQDQIVEYRQGVGARAERLLVEEVHAALKSGAADELLDSLRPQFDKAAEQIRIARTLIPSEGDLATWLHTAEPAAVTAWKSIDSHLAVIDKIGWIASQFGPQLGDFSLIELFAGGDNFKLTDTALFCCGGDLQQDSAYFRRPGTHRASPWCRTKLELHTVGAAREKYRQWCSSEWLKSHYNTTFQHQRPDGSVGEFTLKNPFEVKANA